MPDTELCDLGSVNLEKKLDYDVITTPSYRAPDVIMCNKVESSKQKLQKTCIKQCIHKMKIKVKLQLKVKNEVEQYFPAEKNLKTTISHLERNVY